VDVHDQNRTVADASAGVVPGMTVTATHLHTGLDNACTTSVTACQVSTGTFGQLIAMRAAREIQLGLKNCF
jgi:hypothetical protein